VTSLGRFDCADGIIRPLWTRDDLVVRNAVAADATFIDKLQRENSYAVGFIQQTIWDKYVFGGERNFFVLMCEKNFDPVGYTLITPGRGPGSFVRIQQIAVRDDARRLDYGSALLAVLAEFCMENNRRGARLRCRQDLESNFFWQALGFQRYGVWAKGRVNHVGMKASDDINQWERVLNDSQGSLFSPAYLSLPDRIATRP
jgi:GNAT superfamily N-acetyltransferase